MADLDYLRRKAEAARRFDHAIDGRTFHLRVPTKFESSIDWAQAMPKGLRDDATAVRFNRMVVERAVVGWAGVTAQDVLPTHPDAEPLDYSADAVPVLLDAQPAWEESLLAALLTRIAAGNVVRETAEGN